MPHPGENLRVLADVARELSSFGKPWALVGGLAVSARTEPRFTRDIDVAISVDDDAEAEALVRDLTARSYRLSASVEKDAVARLATARMIPPGREPDEAVVDLPFASSGIEPEISAEADHLEILPGVEVPVAKAGHLLALKLLSRDDATRPQDALDIRALPASLDAEELARARAAATIIERRGFARGRDLSSSLAELLDA